MDHTLVALIILAGCFIISLIYVGMSFSEIRGELKALRNGSYGTATFSDLADLRQFVNEQNERDFAVFSALLAYLKADMRLEQTPASRAKWKAEVFKRSAR